MQRSGRPTGRPDFTQPDSRATSLAPLAHAIGRTRLMVLAAVAAVLLVAATLFVLGAWLAVRHAWQAIVAIWSGKTESTALTVAFLEIVSVMFKAVIFYLIGVGLYSLFVAPLALPTALGVETLNDLESKIISVTIVIMAVTFLEHFIAWQQPTETLMFAVALAVVIAALVLFQSVSNRARTAQHPVDPEDQRRAQRELFHESQERHPPPADTPSSVEPGG